MSETEKPEFIYEPTFVQAQIRSGRHSPTLSSRGNIFTPRPSNRPGRRALPYAMYPPTARP